MTKSRKANEGGEKLPLHDQESGSRIKTLSLRSLAGVLAELLAISSVLAFLLSCFANYLIFRIWGHDFLQLAGPADVIMSGLRILGLFLLPVAGGLALAALFGFIFNKYDKLESFVKQSRWYNRRSDNSKRLIGAIISAIAVLLLFLVAMVTMYPWKMSGTFNTLIEAWISFGLIFIGIGGFGFVRQEIAEGRGSWFEPFAVLFSMVVIVSGGSLALDWFTKGINAQAAAGFHNQWLSVYLDGEDICPTGSRLLWSGSQSLVVRCVVGGSSRVIVLRDSDNAVLIPHAVPQP